MLDIFFENENVVVVDKAPNMLSVPSRLGIDDPRPCVGILLEKQLNQQIYPCHRLDECVGGLIIYAKNANAHRILNHCFEHSLVIKNYYAWTSTAIKRPSIGQAFHWESMLFKGKKRAYSDPKLGKHSITDSVVIEAQAHCLFWKLSPKTGRSHQLRFELFDHGFPIWGDALYGSPYLYQGQEDQIALKMVHFDFTACPQALQLGLPNTLTTSLPLAPASPDGFDPKKDQTLAQMQAFQKRKYT